MHERTAQARLGIIDCFSAGFSLVTRRPWLMALPVLVNLLLWALPRISVRPLVQPLLRDLQVTSTVAPDTASMAEMSVQLLDRMVGSFNLLSLLANGMLRFPSFIATQDSISPDLAHLTTQVIDVRSALVALPLFFLLLLLSVFFAGVYLGLIRREIRREAWDFSGFMGQVVRHWLRLTFFTIGLFLAVLLISIPISVGLAVLSLLAPGLALFASSTVLLLVTWVGIWLFLILHFVIEAIVLDGVGVFVAVWRSINVVLRNFWSTVGIILLSVLLGQGFIIIWQAVARNAWGTFVAIVGDAYIGSGLAAAIFFFYQDRRRRWQASLDAALPSHPT